MADETAAVADAVRVVRRFKVTVRHVVEQQLVYDVDAYDEKGAALQAEHNAAILIVNGREKRGVAKIREHKVLRVDEVLS